MIDREHDLPITRAGGMLRIGRGSVSYLPRSVSAINLEVMRRLDRLRLDSICRLADVSRPAGCRGCKIGRGMSERGEADGMAALYRRPRPGGRARPQDLPVSAARDEDQRRTQCGRWTSPTSRWRVASSIWLSCSDWFSPSRAVVAAVDRDGSGILRRSVEDAFARHGKPDIFNTDQGSQFAARPSPACSPTTALRSTWTVKGLRQDNVFVERLSRSIRYEEVYPRAYDSVGEACVRSAVSRLLQRPATTLET